MNVIFCKPELTMTEAKAATTFFQEWLNCNPRFHTRYLG